MQEDKKMLFKSVDEMKSSLNIFGKLLANIKLKKEKMMFQARDSFMYAVDLADYLVKKGMPFRQAHEITGNIVSYCLAEKKQFSDMFLYEFKKFSKLFEKDIYGVMEPEMSLNTKATTGSTSAKSVKSQLTQAAALIKKLK
jgi:argininosuccinate lyase